MDYNDKHAAANHRKGTQASITAISRQGLFFIPAILVLPGFLGVTGVQLSQPVSDTLSFLLAIPMAISILRELKAQEKEQKEILSRS